MKTRWLDREEIERILKSEQDAREQCDFTIEPTKIEHLCHMLLETLPLNYKEN